MPVGPYMTGRLPAVRPAALADLSVYAKGRLPTPPPTVAVPPAAYPIDGNDRYGDCTMAGVAHLIEAWNVLYGEKDFAPLGGEVVQRYLELTKGADTGLVEANVLAVWHQKGQFKNRIAGYAPVNPNDTLGLHQSIAFYGGVYLGILCPASAQRQFAAGVPWTYEGEETMDGHCIVGLGYDQHGDLLCATWGGLVTVTAGFLAHYLEESWCILSHQLVEAKKDTLGIDLATLQADLARV